MAVQISKRPLWQARHRQHILRTIWHLFSECRLSIGGFGVPFPRMSNTILVTHRFDAYYISLRSLNENSIPYINPLIPTYLPVGKMRAGFFLVWTVVLITLLQGSHNRLMARTCLQFTPYVRSTIRAWSLT
jgi:hypothetical protein